MNVPQWDFLGSTMVTNSYIRLTPDRQSKAGAIWNNVVSNLSFLKAKNSTLSNCIHGSVILVITSPTDPSMSCLSSVLFLWKAQLKKIQ